MSREACKWGAWISRPSLWGGTPHRQCSCGVIQWYGDGDPHKKSGGARVKVVA